MNKPCFQLWAQKPRGTCPAVGDPSTGSTQHTAHPNRSTLGEMWLRGPYVPLTGQGEWPRDLPFSQPSAPTDAQGRFPPRTSSPISRSSSMDKPRMLKEFEDLYFCLNQWRDMSLLLFTHLETTKFPRAGWAYPALLNPCPPLTLDFSSKVSYFYRQWGDSCGLPSFSASVTQTGESGHQVKSKCQAASCVPYWARGFTFPFKKTKKEERKRTREGREGMRQTDIDGLGNRPGDCDHFSLLSFYLCSFICLFVSWSGTA